MLTDKFPGKMLWTGGQRQNDHDCGTPFVWKGLNGELAFNYTDLLEGEPTCNDNVEFCVHLWSNHATLSFASIYGPTMHTVGMTCDAKETPVHCVNIIQWRNPIGQFRSMLYSGPAMFNKLPDDMTNLNSLGFFKNSLKTLINN